jgi:carbamoyl-phosphate synthase small subunit
MVGSAIGAAGTTVGEICFNTGMTGYQELYTDPSYFGQIMVNTHVHIGNYGVVGDEESESDTVHIAGLVTRNFSSRYSRSHAKGSLQTYLADSGIVGLTDVDTRQLVLHIRQHGAMNAVISTEHRTPVALQEYLQTHGQPMDGCELSSRVTTKEMYSLGDVNAQYHIAVYDFGVKSNILRQLVARNCRISVFPANALVSELLAAQPDGILLSNGPGDPKVMDYAIQHIQQLLEQTIPIMGICLGHQLLALALGIPTFKMRFGHRGTNHPIQNLLTSRCEITSQNHGFCVDREALAAHPTVELTHVHLNDQTVAGFRLKGRPVFSVQYHPEASPGPHDSRYLFDQFLEHIQAYRSISPSRVKG